jgi:hypothetical protein
MVGEKNINKIGISPTNMVAYGGVYGIFYGMNWYGDLKFLTLPGPLWVEALYSLPTPTQCFFSTAYFPSLQGGHLLFAFA